MTGIVDVVNVFNCAYSVHQIYVFIPGYFRRTGENQEM